jgi:hypothetical protein
LDITRQAFPLGKTGGTVGRSQYFDQALDAELHSMLPFSLIGLVPSDAAETAARIALHSLVDGSGVAR